MLCTGVGVLLVSKVGRGAGGQHRTELLDEEERKEDSDRSFRLRFVTQENADTFPILICRDSRYGPTEATCCERKVPQETPFHFVVGFIKDLGFRRIILKSDDELSTKALKEPPEGDHMANGRVQMAMTEVKRQCRTPQNFR